MNYRTPRYTNIDIERIRRQERDRQKAFRDLYEKMRSEAGNIEEQPTEIEPRQPSVWEVLSFVSKSMVEVNTEVLKYALGGNRKPRITRAPGSWAVTALRVVVTKRAYEDIFIQLIADGREEHAEALVEGRTWVARWYTLRLNALVVWTLLMWAGVAIVKGLTSLWKAS